MKELERKFSKTERLVARAKFSLWTFSLEVVLSAILGGAIAAIWIFAPKIEGFITKESAVRYLTDQNMKWALLAAAGLVLLIFLFHLISFNRKEVLLTSNNLVAKWGVISVRSFMIPVSEIKIIESEQNALQRLFNYGNVVIISDAESPYKIKNVSHPERFARKVMRQSSLTKTNSRQNFRLDLAASPKTRA